MIHMDKNQPKDKNQKKENSQNQDSKYVLIAAVVIGVILLGGLVALSIGFGKPSVNNTNNATIKNETIKPVQNNSSVLIPVLNQTPTCDDRCNLGNATVQNFQTNCAQINNVAIKDECYGKFANQSFDACKMISNTQNKESCISAFAYREQSNEKCSELSDSQAKNRCIAKVASCNGNTTCIAIAKNDLSVCEGEDSCIFEFSYKTRSNLSCAQISNTQMKAACTYATTNSDACTQLQYQVQRDLCYSLYGEKTKDISACQLIRGDRYLGSCFGAIAAQRKDATVCANSGIGLEELWTCYTTAALETKNATICTNIDKLASNARFECAFESAKRLGDPSACQIITDLGPRIPCYQAILIHDPSKLDPTKCDLVTHPTYQNKCYTEAAKKTGDRSYCDKIEGADERLSCVDAYQRSRIN